MTRTPGTAGEEVKWPGGHDALVGGDRVHSDSPQVVDGRGQSDRLRGQWDARL